MEKIKRNKTRIAMLGLLAIVLSIMGWRMGGAEDTVPVQQPLAVSTDRAATILKPAMMPLSGTVEGLTSSIISSRFSGQITQVLVEDGQSVSAGQALFVLDSVELRNALRVAQNSVNQMAAKYANDCEDYKRSKALYKTGAYSRQQLDSARTKMLASQADYDSALANRSSAEKQVAEATVVSPVNGVIANKNLTNGQNVVAGNSVMTVEQIDAVHVVIQVEQSDMAYLKMGGAVNVMVDTYPDKVFGGVVDVISPVAGKESRMFRVKIRVENPELLLKPGMFVQVQLELGEPQPVLTVPQKAVLGEKGLQYVFTVEEDRAKKVRVKAGDIIGDRIEITEGLREGMVILTDNLDKLKEGTLVQLGAEE